METLSYDLRYGFRMLIKNPGFAAVAVPTMGLGISRLMASLLYGVGAADPLVSSGVAILLTVRYE
jgi:hypothetical protein